MSEREERVNEPPVHRYLKWTDSEDEELLRLFNEKVSKIEIASMFGRSFGAINSRLAHLNQRKPK